MIQTMGGGWVRFVFEEAVEAEVFLVGDFNRWDEWSHRMERCENGTHQILVKLNPGEYEFKYRCGFAWFNDPVAHKYVLNCWGSENSVVVVRPSGRGETLEPGLDDVRPMARETSGPAVQPGA